MIAKPIAAFSPASMNFSLVIRYSRCTVGTDSRKQLDLLLEKLLRGFFAEYMRSRRSYEGEL